MKNPDDARIEQREGERGVAVRVSGAGWRGSFYIGLFMRPSPPFELPLSSDVPGCPTEK